MLLPSFIIYYAAFIAAGWPWLPPHAATAAIKSLRHIAADIYRHDFAAIRFSMLFARCRHYAAELLRWLMPATRRCHYAMLTFSPATPLLRRCRFRCLAADRCFAAMPLIRCRR